MLDRIQLDNAEQQQQRHVVVIGNGIASLHMPALSLSPVIFETFELGGGTYQVSHRRCEQLILDLTCRLMLMRWMTYNDLWSVAAQALFPEPSKPKAPPTATLPSFLNYTNAEKGLIDRYLHENRHASPKDQEAYDQRYGLALSNQSYENRNASIEARESFDERYGLTVYKPN